MQYNHPTPQLVNTDGGMSMGRRIFSRPRDRYETAADAWKDIRQGAKLGATRNFRVVEAHTETDWVFEVTRK